MQETEIVRASVTENEHVIRNKFWWEL